MSEANKAVFLSYARDDAAAARRIAEALRSAGLEVWFDESELRGGDQWDAKIRKQIDACTLFVPVISSHTQERSKGYFRLEWKLAVDQTHLLAEGVPFIAPVVIDDTKEAAAVVPPEFMKVQWSRLPGALPTPQFVEQVKRLMGGKPVAGVADPGRRSAEPGSATPATRKSLPGWTWGALTAVVVGIAVALSVARKPAASPDPKSQPGLRSLGEGGTPDPKPAMATVPVAPVNSKSLAVLPFENLSPDKEDEFFASGIHEEMLTAMQTLQDLRVIQYRGGNKSIRQIGEELHVAFVLECSVRRSGNQVRVTGKLTHARTEELAWAEKFEGELTDVFAIQAQLAKAIATKLSAVISPVEQSVIERRPTTNVAAYDLYLKAKEIRRNAANTEEATLRTEALLVSAVELDPQFALAWGELAFTQAFMYAGGRNKTAAQLAKARASLAKVQQIAPGEAETLRAEGNFYYFTARDYRRAKDLFAQSLALRPNDPESYLSISQVQRREGNWAESVANYLRAIALDPQNDRYLRNAANTLDYCRHYDEAIDLERRRVINPDGNFSPSLMIGISHFRANGSTIEGDRLARDFTAVDQSIWADVTGNYAEVVRLSEQQIRRGPNAAFAMLTLGKVEESQQALEGAQERLMAQLVTQPDNHNFWMSLAEVHLIKGRYDEALACARKAVGINPVSVDALDGPRLAARLARIKAWAGQTDQALSDYARLLRNGGANVHELRAEALPAAFKADPRFQALLADPKNNQPLF